jgi:hypothetical protein
MLLSPGLDEFIEPEPNSGCWLWTGYALKTGYGTSTSDGRSKLVHRQAYEIAVGPIPDGLHIDHLCRVRSCVNPKHLEPVTAAENVRRSAAHKTACVHGHPYDEENTRWHNGIHRECRACDREKKRRRAAL